MKRVTIITLTLGMLLSTAQLANALLPPPPTVDSFTPNSGPVGQSVTLTGTNFTGSGSTCSGMTVKFNGITASCTFVGTTTIKSTVPALATSGPISVTNSGGTGTSGSSFTVTLGISLSKSIGPPTTAVTVNGTAFGANELVDVYVDTTDMVVRATNSNGNFSGAAVTIPSWAVPGTHWITVVGRRTGLAAEKAFTVRTDWPQYAYSPKHKGTNPYENVVAWWNASGLDLDWRIPIGTNFLNSAPVIANGTLYQGSGDGELYAVNATTGAPLWATSAGGVYGSPAVANGIVYVGGNDFKLHAFNATTGAPLWDTGFTIGGRVNTPVVVNGVVYAGAGDNKLYAFNSSSGSPLWNTAGTIGGPIYAAPAVANGVVYVTSCTDQKLYAFDATSGSLLWDSGTTITGCLMAEAVVANGVVYQTALADSKVYAFNAVTGDVLWDTGSSIGAASYIDGPVAVANSVVYAATRSDHKLWAFDGATGTKLWDSGTRIASNIYWGPIVANGLIYVSAYGRRVYAFDANGSRSWAGALPDHPAGPPIIANGMIYVATSTGSSGAITTFDLAAGPSAPPKPDPRRLRPDPSLRPEGASR